MTKPFEPDEKMLEVLRRGALARIELKPLTYSDAVSLRMKFYRLKDKLAKHKHPDHASARLTTMKLTETDPGVFALIVHPSNWGFEKAFTNAGITDKNDDFPSLDD